MDASNAKFSGSKIVPLSDVRIRTTQEALILQPESIGTKKVKDIKRIGT